MNPETLREFDSYQSTVDREFRERLNGQQPFLWIDQQPAEKRKLEKGKILTHSFTGPNGRSVTDGLVHDWLGVMYLPGVRLDAVRSFLIDAEKHPSAFPAVKDAKTLSRTADGSVTKLRFVKKKIMTVVLDCEYKNQWQDVGPDRWIMTSRSQKVNEIVDDGQTLPPDTGHGFLWRMNSQWSLRQDAGGLWVELRSVSLSRDTPRGLGWIIRPLIRNFPVEAILSTLEGTRARVSENRAAD